MLAYLHRLRALRSEQIGAGGRGADETWLGVARGADGLTAVTATSLDALLGFEREPTPIRIKAWIGRSSVTAPGPSRCSVRGALSRQSGCARRA